MIVREMAEMNGGDARNDNDSGSNESENGIRILRNGRLVEVGTEPVRRRQLKKKTYEVRTGSVDGTNGNYGVMFDVVSLSGKDQIKIESLDFLTNIEDPHCSLTIYGRHGTHLGHTTTSRGWNLLVNSSQISCQSDMTHVPQTLFRSNPLIPEKQKYAFYVALNTPHLRYVDGNKLNSIVGQSKHLAILEGSGVSTKSFGKTVKPRIWNGVIHYTLLSENKKKGRTIDDDDDDDDDSVSQFTTQDDDDDDDDDDDGLITEAQPATTTEQPLSQPPSINYDAINIPDRISNYDGETCDTSLLTTYYDNLGSFGNMFDILTYEKDISLYQFDFYTDLTSEVQYELYTKHNGFRDDHAKTNLDKWTLLQKGTATGMGIRRGTPIHLKDSLWIPSNSKRAFFITLTTTDIRYRNIEHDMPHAVVGTPFVSDENLEIHVGVSVGEYPIGRTFFGKRAWSGTLHYIANAACPSEEPSGTPSDTPSTDYPSRLPSWMPSGYPTGRPSCVPTTTPTQTPTTAIPTPDPTTHAPILPDETLEPTVVASESPTLEQTTVSPTQNPITVSPTQSSTIEPTTLTPTPVPTTHAPIKPDDTLEPTLVASDTPTVQPTTSSPTPAPTTHAPTKPNETLEPTIVASATPTIQPTTSSPTPAPTTHAPIKPDETLEPTMVESAAPIMGPTTDAPSKITPTPDPTTRSPTVLGDTFEPTVTATEAPTPTTTDELTIKQTTPDPTTHSPTAPGDTMEPITTATITPTDEPSTALHPTLFPTTHSPTMQGDTREPTNIASSGPTQFPSTASPTQIPRASPSRTPTRPGDTFGPTNQSSSAPSKIPSSSAPIESSFNPSVHIFLRTDNFFLEPPRPAPTPAPPTGAPVTRRPSSAPIERSACQDHHEVQTTFAGGTGAFGNMFTVTSKDRALAISTVSFHTDYDGDVTAEVYTRAGDFVGFENDPHAWTRVARAAVHGAGMDHGSVIPKEHFDAIHMKPNETVSLYVTLTTADIRYTRTNRTLGEPLASHEFLDVNAGAGLADYPYATEFFLYVPRAFNGIVHFDIDAECLPTVDVTYSFNVQAPKAYDQPKVMHLVENSVEQAMRGLFGSEFVLMEHAEKHKAGIDRVIVSESNTGEQNTGIE